MRVFSGKKAGLSKNDLYFSWGFHNFEIKPSHRLNNDICKKDKRKIHTHYIDSITILTTKYWI